MRVLSNIEVASVSGREMECSSNGDMGSGYASCWDSAIGLSVTMSYGLMAAGDADFSAFINYQGDAYSFTFNTMEALGSAVFGLGVVAMGLPLGLGTAGNAALGLLAETGYNLLWEM